MCKLSLIAGLAALFLLTEVSALVEISTFEEFSTALASAPEGETIRFQPGKYHGVCGVELSKSLTIIGGPDVELDCEAQASHFRVVGPVSVALNNIAFTHGVSQSGGGCLLISHGAIVNISGCSFSECVAAQHGGAVHVQQAAKAQITDSTFSRCSADQGGAVSVHGPDSHAIMDGCALTNNSALQGGGAILESASLEVRGSTLFLGNIAERGGGIAGDLAVNSSHASTISVESGAVFQHNLAFSLTDGVFARGGGIYLVGGSSIVCSGDVSFVGNEAQSAESAGGALYISGPGTARFVATTGSHNSATYGGGIFAGGGAYFEAREGAVLSHNTAMLYGGSIYSEGAGTVLDIQETAIKYSAAFVGSGIVLFTGVTANLFNGVDVMHNHAVLRGAGVFLLKNNWLNTKGRVQIHHNTANLNAAGIGLHAFNVGNLTAGTTVKGNIASHGSGVYVSDNSILSADGVEFTDNIAAMSSALDQGGGLFCQDCTAHVRGCYFARNVAYIGGGFYWRGAGSCTNCRFEDNVAEIGGGMAHLSDTSAILDRAVFINNSATDGGCLASADSSTLLLSASTFENCSASRNGGSLMVKDDGEVQVSGDVTMQRGTAGGSGGAIDHQGALIWIHPEASLLVSSNAASAGGAISMTSAVKIEGLLRVVGNVARDGDGGGVQGFGMWAALSVSESGWLEVAGNEALSANGGGVALLDNARLVFDFQTACPSTCQGLGDGACSPTCMLHQCRWDGGECDDRLFEAGEQAEIPCGRVGQEPFRCHLTMLLDSSTTCPEGCISTPCEWGFGRASCAPVVQAIGECPYLNALVYDSVAANSGVRYVKEGGTAGGYGRCESETCSAADPSIGRDEPYCTTLNDGGRVIELDCDECLTSHEVGESWGPCAPIDKPRLPHIGFDYDPAEMRAILDMGVPTMLRRYPGCGFQPMAIRQNRAALAGGGVYKDRCDAFLESADRCFVGELENQRLPTAVIDIADNHAGGPGGGFFVECGEMVACLRALEAEPGLPAYTNASDRLMHFGAHSASDAYGSQAAGRPVQLQLTGPPANATPGQTLIDVSYRLLDSQGLVVRGSASWPNPHVVEVSVCKVGQACTAAEALQPPLLLRSHPTDASTSTLRAEQLLGLCPSGDHRVEFHVRAGGEGPLHRSVVVGCEPCGPGQEMVLVGEGDAQLWSCRSCQPTEYVVSAEGGCQPCPLEGAACDGLSLTPTVGGAEWVAEGATRRVEFCPPGYILVRDPALPVLDTCAMCPPGTYSTQPARFPDTLTVGRAADAPLMCADCVPGAECLGGPDIISLPGYWEDLAARDARRAGSGADVTFYQCSPGACEGNNTCSQGRSGPVCGLCEEEWARSGLECVHCGTDTVGKPSHVPSFVITVICGCIVLYLLTWRPLLEESERAVRARLCCSAADDDEGEGQGDLAEASHSWLQALRYHLGKIQWTSPAMIGAFKVAVSFYQVASTFNLTFRIDWPDSFRLINSLGRLTGLDLSLLLPSVACVTREYDHMQALVAFTTVFPLSMTLVLCVPYLFTLLLGVVYHGGAARHLKHDVMQRYCLRAVLLWFFLIFPTVSEQTITTFFCKDLGSGGHVLALDTRVACPWGGASPSGGFYFALFLVLLYPVGIPAFFYYTVSAFFVPAMAESKYRRALFSELIKLYRAETSTPVSVKLAQHVGVAAAANDAAPATPITPMPGAGRVVRPAFRQVKAEAGESAVRLQSFKRRVSQLFTHTFVQRELSGVTPASSLHDKLRHVLEQLECSDEELVRVVTVLQRLSISTAVGEGLDAFEQLALKISHNHFLFTGHETLDGLSLEQLQALFLFDWEGINRKRSESEIGQRKVRRQRLMRSMDCEQLRSWVFNKAQELEKAKRITVPTVNWNGESPEEERALAYVGFLFDDFRVQTWWFFVLGELCKLVMTSLMVFVPGSLWQQLAWGFFVQVCITSLYVVYQPMAEQWLNQFQVYALTVQCAILFFGLVVAVADLDHADHHSALEAWASFIVVLKWSLVFCPLAIAVTGRAVGGVQAALRRAVGGSSEEQEPLLVERLLFPTSANQKRLRRSSTGVDSPLRLTKSVSDADLLGVDACGVGTPTTRSHLRATNSVDAQLVTPRLETSELPAMTETGFVSNEGRTETVLVSPGGRAAEHSEHMVVAAETLPAASEHVAEASSGSGLSAGRDVDRSSRQASPGSVFEVDDSSPGASPNLDELTLELSVTPTPRK